MNPTKITIVLVTGAWHKPELYSSLTEGLKQLKYKVIAPALLSVGGSQDTFDEDVQLIRKIIEDEVTSGQDVVVLMHSYGGMVGGAAVKRLSKKEVQTGGGVVRMIYMTAFALDEGVTLMDSINNVPLPWMESANDKQWKCIDSPNIFYNDVDPAIASKITEQLLPHAKGAFESKQTYAAWKHIDSTYIICEIDNAIPKAAQQQMAFHPEGKIQTEYLKAGHSPFLSMPEETVEIIRKAIDTSR